MIISRWISPFIENDASYEFGSIYRQQITFKTEHL